jgi:hypothetical protein
MAREASLTKRLEGMGKEKEKAKKKTFKPLRAKGITDGREDLENFNTRLIEGTHTDMKVYCARNKITIQNFVNEAIIDRLKK